MPKQHRWAIKQELESAEKNLSTAQGHVVKFGHEFETVHPDIYNKFCDIVRGLDLLKEAIAGIREAI